METLRIDLPPDYDPAHTIAFHGRDKEAAAEQVTPQPANGAHLRKGVMLAGVPVILEIEGDASDLSPAWQCATCRIIPAAPLDSEGRRMAHDALHNMLGLRIDPLALATMVRDDPLLAPLVNERPGLRIIQSATVFEALTWAIIGQQINLTFAIALRRTLIMQAGRQHPSGLWCYPEARDVASLDLEHLTSRKFSRAKAETLLRVARLVDSGELELRKDGDIESTCAALLAIKGIGPWTVNYALLRGFGHPDCSLEGDVAVRTALQRLLAAEQRPSIAEAAKWLAQYAPHRTMVAAHLWASL